MTQVFDMNALVKAGKDLGLKIEVGSATPGLQIGTTHQTWDEFSLRAIDIFQRLNAKTAVPAPVYYEICFYGANHPDEWNFYIESERKLTDVEVKQKLKDEFIGVDGLTLALLDHIDYIQTISVEEYKTCRGLS